MIELTTIEKGKVLACVRRNQTASGCANCKFYFNGDCTNFDVCKGSSTSYSTNKLVIDITLPIIELETTRLDSRVSYIKQNNEL